MFGGVGVAGADVFVLQGFELLLGAEFVGLDRVGVSWIWEGGGEGGRTMVGMEGGKRRVWWWL